MIATLALAFALLQSTPDFDPEESFSLVQRFARCTALYDALASQMDAAGYPANVEELRGNARGALISSRFFAYYAGLPEERIDGAISSFVELEANRQRAFAERHELD